MTTKLALQLKEILGKNYVLIWLDDKVNDQLEYPQFGDIAKHLHIVQTIDQYEAYLRTISPYARVSLLLDSQSASELVSREHSFKRLSSIYIYGEEKFIDDPRVKYIADIRSDALLTNLQIDRTKATEPFTFSLYKPSSNLDQSLSFFHFHIIIDCLLRLQTVIPNQTHLISLLRRIEPGESKLFDEFEQTYSADRAVEWYQRETCLSTFFQRVLCSTNASLLFLFRFFLRDLQQRLAKRHYSSATPLYETRFLSKEDLELLKNSIGDFLAINPFVTATVDRREAMAKCHTPETLQAVLFELDCSRQEEKSLADLNPSQVLMMCASIFRIVDVRFDDNQIWIIQLKSAQSTDEDLHSIFRSIQTELGYHEHNGNLLTFGTLLWKMKRLTEAEDYFLYLLDLLPDDHLDRVDIYYRLGHIYSDQNQLDLSIQFYQKSLDIRESCLPLTDITLANNYNAIAANFWKKGDCQHAYQLFQKALETFQQIFGHDHITVGMCLNNLATVISDQKDYSKMLDYYLQALRIFQQHLPNNHPNLASLHCNISTMYKNLHQVDFALEHMLLSLKIYDKIYPVTHSNVSMALKNIAHLYEQKGDVREALNYHEQLASIYRQTLPPTDPLVQQNEEKIEDLESKLWKN